MVANTKWELVDAIKEGHGRTFDGNVIVGKDIEHCSNTDAIATMYWRMYEAGDIYII